VAVTAIYLVRPPAAFVVPGPDVVQVALVDPSATPVQPTPAPPEPKVEEPEEAIEPEPEKGVKLEPPKTKKKEPPPKNEKAAPPKPTSARAPLLGSAQVGTAGLRGDVGVDAGDFEFTYYLVLIRNKIAGNWAPPAGLSTGGNPVRAVVYFRVGRGGEISAMRIEAPSGTEVFDRSTIRAVTLSDPLPPLPLGFPGGDLGVHFGFEWESP
jgi:TonB family protein